MPPPYPLPGLRLAPLLAAVPWYLGRRTLIKQTKNEQNRFWPPWGALGGSWAAPRGALGASRAALGARWAAPKSFSAQKPKFVDSIAFFLVSWGSGRPPGASWGPLGALLAAPGALLRLLGRPAWSWVALGWLLAAHVGPGWSLGGPGLVPGAWARRRTTEAPNPAPYLLYRLEWTRALNAREVSCRRLKWPRPSWIRQTFCTFVEPCREAAPFRSIDFSPLVSSCRASPALILSYLVLASVALVFSCLGRLWNRAGKHRRVGA